MAEVKGKPRITLKGMYISQCIHLKFEESEGAGPQERCQ